MPRLTLLGTGAARTTSTRDNTAAVLTLAGKHLLIDTPGSPVPKLHRAGVDPLDLELVILTHRHVDHTYGLPSLLQHRLIARKTTPSIGPLRILCLTDTASVIEPVLNAYNTNRADQPPVYAIDVLPNLSTGHTVRTDLWNGWSARLIGGDHNGVPVITAVFEHPEGPRILYATDTEPTRTLLAHAAGADVLCHSCQCARRDAHAPGHSDAEELADILTQLGWPKKLVPLHIAGDEVAAAEIGRVLGRASPGTCTVHIADDGETVHESRT